MKLALPVLTALLMACTFSAKGQCSPDDVTHYHMYNLPATLTGGIDVALSGNNSGPRLQSDTTSCSWNDIGAIILYPNDEATFTFSQPIFGVSFALHGLNMGENGTVTTNGEVPAVSSNCNSGYTISANYFERTSGAENFNGIPIHISILGGATIVTITCNAINGSGPGAWVVDLLDCIDNVVGVSNPVFDNELKAYPNPTNGNFSLDFGGDYTNTTVIIRNTLGQEIQSNTYPLARHLDLHIEGESGVYFVEVRSESKRAVLKLVKQ